MVFSVPHINHLCVSRLQPDTTLLSQLQPHDHWGLPDQLLLGFWNRSGQSPQLGKLERLWVPDTAGGFVYLPEESALPSTHPQE